SSITLPGNYQAIKSYNYYKIEKINKENAYEYILEDEVILPNHKAIRKVAKKEGKSNNIIRLNSKDIILPLKVRTKKDGDRMMVKNLNGTKKVKNIFIDEKIPKAKRDE